MPLALCLGFPLTFAYFSIIIIKNGQNIPLRKVQFKKGNPWDYPGGGSHSERLRCVIFSGIVQPKHIAGSCGIRNITAQLNQYTRFNTFYPRFAFHLCRGDKAVAFYPCSRHGAKTGNFRRCTRC